MTDNRTTELLRKLLEERGEEWSETVNSIGCVFTWYESAYFGEVGAMDNGDGYLYFNELNGVCLTPEQAIAATLGNGTLTAEQVMAIAGKHQPDYCSDTHACFDWQAIADELNAELGSGTCELVETDSYSDANEVIHVLECSECGKTCEHVNGSYPRCPHCGAKVKE